MCELKWKLEDLSQAAKSVSASRRTDIPAFYGDWFSHRLAAGFAEYIPSGPPRRCRCSLRPADVTYFDFWTKNPRPFFPVLRRVLEIGYPVFWNVTVTGLGGTPVESHVPPADRVVASIRELAEMVPPSAILWRYDPVFVSDQYGEDYHVETFTRLAGELAGHVDRRIAISFLGSCYERRVQADLRRYESETGDEVGVVPLDRQVDLAGRLRDCAAAAGLELTLCCSPELRQATGYPGTGCNSFEWARRVYPALEKARDLKLKPTRPGCLCSEEIDIGCYDTCIHGCRYSYGSRSYETARANYQRHNPQDACLISGGSAAEAESAQSLPIV